MDIKLPYSSLYSTCLMGKRLAFYLILQGTLMLKFFPGMSQPLPANIPVFEEALRRGQILGLIDSSFSFALRPAYPKRISDLSQSYYIQNIFQSQDSTVPNLEESFHFKVPGKLVIIPPSYQFQFNSHHPYGWADGYMISNRGYQQIVSAGLFYKIGPVVMAFRPETIFAENKEFEEFPHDTNTDLWLSRYYYWNEAFPSERFGTGKYSKNSIGQSSFGLELGSVSVAVSNENIWWGPGQFNSLIFSNNGPGFKHLTINTNKPIKTPLGTLEGQILIGKLESPNFTPVYGGVAINNKRQDWRNLTGMLFTFSPKWTPGLFIGFGRTFQQYHEDVQNTFSSRFPLLQALQKQSTGLSVDSNNQDQQIVIFSRYLLRKAKAELYFEFGRRDHALNWRDFIMSPDHARGFIIGFSKIFTLSTPDQIIVRFEATQTQESINALVRYEGESGGQSWGTHVPVTHGFSHLGQQLGNGIGPGNNSQTLEIAWVKDIRKLGIMFERVENQMDFFNRAFRDNSPARPWVDLSTGLVGNWRFNRLVANAKIQLIKSLNYQWQQDFIYPGGQNARGVDRFNLHSYMGVTYLF